MPDKEKKLLFRRSFCITKKRGRKMMRKVIGKLRKKARAKKQTVSAKKVKQVRAKISSEELHSLIEEKAYNIYEEKGRAWGNELENWCEAEKIVLEGFEKS